MNITKALAAVAITFAVSAPAFASLTYSTGQDLNFDGVDDAFTVNGKGALLVTDTARGWPLLPNSSITSGRYISWHADQSGRPSTFQRGANYDFAFDFMWGEAQTPGTRFDFRWISDDYLTDVLLNGNSLGINNFGKTAVWTISNSASVFAALNHGRNTMQFLVNNAGGGAVGLAADFTIHGAATPADPGTDVPEPASLALMAGALGLLAARRKRRA